MSPSKLFDDTPVNYADVQPSEPKPVLLLMIDNQRQIRSLPKYALKKKFWINVFPDAKVHSDEKAPSSNGLARGDSNRRSD
ncbi:hypothetical protein BGAL_0091g00200 [Botrytis galanthina]|uniref:Uncharacterized protein n=1 Tax=Botrytis galanthina TaxID=278940 RepID=A0A4S8R6Z1_9HELO|nr:hypothetical protein BGAL_0091g00200 [Botrytis galanthina]